MPAIVRQEADSLWGLWRVAFNIPMNDPRAMAVTPEQALLDLEVSATVKGERDPDVEDWFDTEIEKAKEATVEAPELAGDVPSVEDGNKSLEAAMARLAAMRAANAPKPNPNVSYEIVSLED